MKVCIVCAGLPPFYGGAEMRAFRHAQRLRREYGIDTILIGLHRRRHRIAEQSLPENVHGVRLCFSNVGGTDSPKRLVRLLCHIAEVSIRLGALMLRLRSQYDVIHIFNPVTWFNLVPIILARFLNKPVIVEMTLRGADDPLKLSRQGAYRQPQLFGHRPLKYSLFLQADSYVSKSYGLSDAYRQAGLPESRLFQIPSGVDITKFSPVETIEKDRYRRMLDLPLCQTIILFVGGIEPRKGVHRLLEAFHGVSAEQPETHLVIVGPSQRFDPAYIQTLRDNVASWGLSGRVTFVEKLASNVHEYMKAADIFALPSSREGFSMAILEAMSSGLPVVASDIPEVAGTQIKHPEEGLLVPVGDRQRLTDALARLITDEELRIGIGQAARERVLREFTHEAVDSQYLRLYWHCLS